VALRVSSGTFDILTFVILLATIPKHRPIASFRPAMIFHTRMAPRKSTGPFPKDEGL
jgi:hypothetical protein